MGSFLHKETKRYYPSTTYTELPGNIEDYIHTPDLSNVIDISPMYWKIDGDVISEMNQVEKDAVNLLAETAKRDSAIGELDNAEGTMRQVIRLIIKELNILRAINGLSDRTLAQLKSQIRSEYGN